MEPEDEIEEIDESVMEEELAEEPTTEIEIPIMEIKAPNEDILELYDDGTPVSKQCKAIKEFMRLHKYD